MKINKKFGRLSVIAFLTLAVLTLAACGGGPAAATPVPPSPSATPTAVPAPTPAPTAVPAPTEAAVVTPGDAMEATPTPGAMPTPEPTAVPAPTLAPTAIPAPTTAPSLTPTTAPTSTPTPALPTSIDDYGFTLKLDEEADTRAAGWSGPEPNAQQGTISFASGGVSVALIWSPQEGREPLTFLADTYNILRTSQSDFTFEPLSDGDIVVDREPGAFGGFKTLDAGGATLGGGLIGTWVCTLPQTAFRMTLTGDDATLVQLRFDRLLENFSCSS